MCQCGYGQFEELIQDMIKPLKIEMDASSENPGNQVFLKERIYRL